MKQRAKEYLSNRNRLCIEAAEDIPNVDVEALVDFAAIELEAYKEKAYEEMYKELYILLNEYIKNRIKALDNDQHIHPSNRAARKKELKIFKEKFEL